LHLFTKTRIPLYNYYTITSLRDFIFESNSSLVRVLQTKDSVATWNYSLSVLIGYCC